MFGADFFPTPLEVIEQMLQDENLQDKTVWEPSAGKGDIVDYCKRAGANVIACEKDADLRTILQSKCRVIGHDCLTMTSIDVSHVNYIVMNPPFSADEKHILHAFNIAPPGCKIIALCNWETIRNPYHRRREELQNIVEMYGHAINIGEAFSNAQRKTEIEIGLIRLHKPGGEKENEFEGFFLDEEQEPQANAIMPYNFIRELVNRYVASVKIFDEQLAAAVKMNDLCAGFFKSNLSMEVKDGEKVVKRNEFKKDMQKQAWRFIFEKMNMQKFATRGLMADINKFVEQQTQIPFTMRNIYRMLEIVIGTQQSRMDKALEEAFDAVTKHHDENRYNVEGWKTNSHYLLGQKFILPYLCDYDSRWPNKHVRVQYNSYRETIEDMVKALCHLTGMDYAETTPLSYFCSNLNMEWGQWYSWGFFEIRGYKKGSMHFKFQDKDLWAKFNQEIARIKGYPLFEPKKKAA